MGCSDFQICGSIFRIGSEECRVYSLGFGDQVFGNVSGHRIVPGRVVTKHLHLNVVHEDSDLRATGGCCVRGLELYSFVLRFRDFGVQGKCGAVFIRSSVSRRLRLQDFTLGRVDGDHVGNPEAGHISTKRLAQALPLQLPDFPPKPQNTPGLKALNPNCQARTNNQPQPPKDLNPKA